MIAEYWRLEEAGCAAIKLGTEAGEEEGARILGLADAVRGRIEQYRPVALRGVLAALDFSGEMDDPNCWPEGAVEGLRAISQRQSAPDDCATGSRHDPFALARTGDDFGPGAAESDPVLALDVERRRLRAEADRCRAAAEKVLFSLPDEARQPARDTLSRITKEMASRATETDALEKRVLRDYRAAVARQQAVIDASGYPALEEEAEVAEQLHAEAEDRFLGTPASTVAGVMAQLAVMREYAEAYDGLH
ncbi:MAG TPA: hypothetical protein VFX06_10740 [Stellaceae bacterium]|nr:hypothetical protein [Stellaceae bacterium]